MATETPDMDLPQADPEAMETEATMPSPAPSPWNSLERTKVFVAVLVPISILFTGELFSRAKRESDDVAARQEAVIKLSRAILERRSRTELVYSSILRQEPGKEIAALRDELVRRKKEYDATFVAWNAGTGENLIVLRRAAAADTYSAFENYFQKSLSVGVFKPLDKCLTAAYDDVLKGNHDAALERFPTCRFDHLLGQAQNCGYAIVSQARAIIEGSTDEKSAVRAFEEVCPQPVSPGTGESD